MLYEAPNKEKCLPLHDTYEDASADWFCKCKYCKYDSVVKTHKHPKKIHTFLNLPLKEVIICKYKKLN